VVWGGEALPRIPDTVRSLFASVAALNERGDDPAAAAAAGRGDGDGPLGRRLSRSLHVGRDSADPAAATAAADSDSDHDGGPGPLPSAAARQRAAAAGGRKRKPALHHGPSTAELEDLLHSGWAAAAAEEEDEAGAGAGAGRGPRPSQKRRTLTAQLCGRCVRAAPARDGGRGIRRPPGRGENGRRPGAGGARSRRLDRARAAQPGTRPRGR
jgi:hypothetical protein